MGKYDYYEKVKVNLESMGFEVGQFRDINYGLQFIISKDGAQELIRIYESKKGDRIDLSQVKNKDLQELLSRSLDIPKGPVKTAGTDRHETCENADPPELIGTDESGKGDYFGPLVISSVYSDNERSDKLRKMGVDDSKKLSDSKIAKLAPQIMEICPYSVVVIENFKYNELYEKIGNLNRLLAWGHARAIENVLEMVDCKYALSDQFGNPSLIENALLEKGRSITLAQRPRAEENTAVAAASILARYEFASGMDKLKEKYGMELPKGASSMVNEAAGEFIKKYGIEELKNAAKLHFKITPII